MTIRVGVVGPPNEDDFAYNIADGLKELQIQAELLGSQFPSIGGGRVQTLMRMASMDRRVGGLAERSVVRRALDGGFDAVVTVVSLHPDSVKALAKAGIKVAFWFPDHVSNIGKLDMFDAPYSGLFFKEPRLVQHLNAFTRLPVHYLPEACNPRIHHPVGGGPAYGKVVVVGNLHAIRARLLERLVDDAIPIAIYGNPRHAKRYESLAPFHVGRYVRGLEKAAVFSSGTAVLNNLHPGEIEGVNCRLFEATASGGAVVTEHKAELPRLFEPNVEVFTFRDYEGLLHRLRELVSNPGVASDLRIAASKRALNEHTYDRRLSVMLERLL